MGYNFTCARNCSLPNEHMGPCDTLTDTEALAQAVLATYEDGVDGYCVHCYVKLHGKDAVHKPACITHLAQEILNRRERNIKAAKELGVT